MCVDCFQFCICLLVSLDMCYDDPCKFSIRQTLVLYSGYVVETACELYTVPAVWEANWCWQGYSSVNVCWLFSVLYLPTCLTWHVLWWSLQVSIRQTLVLHSGVRCGKPLVSYTPSCCLRSTLMLAGVLECECVLDCFSVFVFAYLSHLDMCYDDPCKFSIRQTLVLHSGYVVETACELYTVLLSWEAHWCWQGYSSVNVCWLFSVLYLPTCLTWHVLWWSLQVSIRQTLVLHSGYVVETACELYTVLLSEKHIDVGRGTRVWMCVDCFSVLYFAYLSHLTCAMMILASFSIRQTLVLHSGYVVETACEFFTVLLSEKHIDVGRGIRVWMCVDCFQFCICLLVSLDMCYDDPCKFPFGRP